jgi:hypothetical protein
MRLGKYKAHCCGIEEMLSITCCLLLLILALN